MSCSAPLGEGGGGGDLPSPLPPPLVSRPSPPVTQHLVVSPIQQSLGRTGEAFATGRWSSAPTSVPTPYGHLSPERSATLAAAGTGPWQSPASSSTPTPPLGWSPGRLPSSAGRGSTNRRRWFHAKVELPGQEVARVVVVMGGGRWEGALQTHRRRRR